MEDTRLGREGTLTEGEFRTALEQVAVGIAVTGLDHRFLEANAQLLRDRRILAS